MQNDLWSYSSLSYFASDFKTDFLGEWQKDKHFFFLLNTCTILLSENKTFLLSSKETRFKNNDKILSQLTLFGLTIIPLLNIVAFSLFKARASSYSYLHCLLILFILVFPIQLVYVLTKDSRLNKYLLSFTYSFSRCFQYVPSICPSGK